MVVRARSSSVSLRFAPWRDTSPFGKPPRLRLARIASQFAPSCSTRRPLPTGRSPGIRTSRSLSGLAVTSRVTAPGAPRQAFPTCSRQYTHFSPLAGLPDTPENYHTVTIDLSAAGDRTRVSLSQDNNPTDKAREHSEKNWEAMLAGLKQFLEKGRA